MNSPFFFEPELDEKFGLKYGWENDLLIVRNNLGEELVRIGPLKENNPYFIVRWFGTALDGETIEILDKIALPAFILSRTHRWLNDNSQDTSPWDGINEWIDTVYMPKALEAGLTRLAMLESADVFAQISAQNFAENSEDLADLLAIRFFDDENEALKWLAEE